MIRLSFFALFHIYLGVTLVSILGIWLFTNAKKYSKPPLTSEKELYLCEYCHFTYLADQQQEITSCPQCGSKNKGNKYRT